MANFCTDWHIATDQTVLNYAAERAVVTPVDVPDTDIPAQFLEEHADWTQNILSLDPRHAEAYEQ